MRHCIRRSIVLYLVLLTTVATAASSDNLIEKLNKISMQVDKAQIFAANCVVDSQADNKLHDSCINANILLVKAHAKLERIALLNTNNIDEINDNIKQLQQKISQTNDHLTEAKIATGDYEWTDNFIPSINLK